jgi:thiol-disulfide isomerase/thioredoxin
MNQQNKTRPPANNPIMKINSTAIKKIMAGRVRLPNEGPCISLIKFYGKRCKYCINLQKTYENIARANPDINFFVFDIEEEPDIQKRLDFNGVPMIFGVTTLSKYGPTIVERIDEPTEANPHTWYVEDDFAKLIEKVRVNV